MSQKDYSNVFKNKNIKVNSENWRVFSIENNKSYARLGLSIAKKILNRAVDRNRFKRLAREFFRNNQEILAPKDFVIMVNKSKTKNNLNKRSINNQQLRLELTQLLS